MFGWCARVLVVAWFAVSCGPRYKLGTVFEDGDGVLCLDHQGTLRVDWQRCLSGSCERLVDAFCDLVPDGDGFVVHAGGAVEMRSPVFGATLTCNDDCLRAGVVCELPPLDDPDGLVLVYGQTESRLSELPACW